MGTHLRVLRESYPMNTNMTGFRWFSEIFAPLFVLIVFKDIYLLVLWKEVASALEGLNNQSNDVYIASALSIGCRFDSQYKANHIKNLKYDDRFCVLLIQCGAHCKVAKY